MFYRKVYPQSIKAIRQYPALIFFGLFASILGFSEIKTIFNLTDAVPDFIGSMAIYWAEISMLFSYSSFGWSQLPDLFALMGLFIIFSVATILAVSSQGALIKASVNGNGKGKKPSFTDYLNNGLEKFWPLLGLNVINTLIGYFFIMLVIEPIIYFLVISDKVFVDLLLAVLIFFVLIPLVVVISFVTRYGAAYVVLKNEKLPAAFVQSWELFRVNWLITVENAFVLTLVTVFYFLILASLTALIFIPFLLFGLLMALGNFFFWLIIVLGVIAATIVLILGTSLFGAFYNIVWANIWKNLTTPGKSQSKVQRLSHKHLPGLNR